MNRGEPTTRNVAQGAGEYMAETQRNQTGIITIVLLLAITLLWTIGWYWPTARHIGSIWWSYETFQHGLVVFPISAWLIWLRRKAIIGLAAEPVPWMAVPVALASAGWFVGELVTVNALAHLSLMTALVLAFVGVLGWEISRRIAFPLAFLFFGVPIGEFLTPKLMDYTAVMTVWALRLTGIPVYQEGLFFVIPSGRWSVVEACSGIRYLIASVMVGTLFAYLNYTSLKRRLIFVGVSIVVPIIANWMRAYIIVMIGHLSDNRLAAGVDHLLYGWVFFGIVIALMFAIGARWREDEPLPRKELAENTLAVSRRSLSSIALKALPTFVLLAAFPLALQRIDAAVPPFEVALVAPPPAQGWAMAEEIDLHDYQPRFRGQRSTVFQTYRHESGDVVVLYIAYYAEQRAGSQLITSSNRLNFKDDEADVNWQLVSRRAIEMPPGRITRTMLSDKGRLIVAWHWFWSNGSVETDDRRAKIAFAINRLTGRSDDAAFVAILSLADDVADDSRPRVSEFLEQHFGAIEGGLNRAKNSR